MGGGEEGKGALGQPEEKKNVIRDEKGGDVHVRAPGLRRRQKRGKGGPSLRGGSAIFSAQRETCLTTGHQKRSPSKRSTTRGKKKEKNVVAVSLGGPLNLYKKKGD